MLAPIVLVRRRRKPTIFNTAFADGDACLTDIAARESFSMQASPRATSFLLREVGGGDNASVDRSTNILTGMIIAALYVILLVGFVRESYTYRDAALLDSEKVSGISWRDIPKSACRIDPALCRQSETVAASRPRDMWQVIRDDR